MYPTKNLQRNLSTNLPAHIVASAIFIAKTVKRPVCCLKLDADEEMDLHLQMYGIH